MNKYLSIMLASLLAVDVLHPEHPIKEDEMKKLLKLGGCILVFMMLSGCYNFHTHTKAIVPRESKMLQFSMKEPVEIRNIALQTGETTLGKWTGWKVSGDYHEHTAACIGTLKIALKKRNIQVSPKADKTLELAVVHAEVERSAWVNNKLRVTTVLVIRTGDGLKRKYEGRQDYFMPVKTTEATEQALSYCVEQMLNDKYVTSYLQN